MKLSREFTNKIFAKVQSAPESMSGFYIDLSQEQFLGADALAHAAQIVYCVIAHEGEERLTIEQVTEQLAHTTQFFLIYLGTKGVLEIIAYKHENNSLQTVELVCA